MIDNQKNFIYNNLVKKSNLEMFELENISKRFTLERMNKYVSWFFFEN